MPTEFAFTEVRVRALTPPTNQEREYHKDTTFPGLQVSVFNTGTKVYYFVKRVDGKPTRIKLGSTEQMSVAQARKAAAKHIGKIAEGANPQAERKARRQEPTIALLWDHWLIYARAHKKPLSVEYDELNYGKHLKAWSARRLSSIKRSDVQALHSAIGQTSGPYAANRVLALLRAMLNKAEDIGYRGPNPASKITKFKEQSRDRFLQPQELEAFFTALNAQTPLFRDFFTIALLTGARKNNVQMMRWDQLNLDSGLWRIPETKGGIVVVVPLVAPAVAILKARQLEANGCEWVFPGHRRGDYMREPRESWKRICKAAGIDDLHIHDLRRSLGSWMAGQNVSLQIIGKMLGHRTPQATAVYSRLTLDPVRHAVDSAATAMLTAGKQTQMLTVEQEGQSNG